MHQSVILYSTIGLAVVTGLVGLWRYPHLVPSLRYIALLACFDAVMELIAFVVATLHYSNLFLFPIVLTSEVLLLTLAYRRALASAPLAKVLHWALGGYVAFVALETARKLGTVQYYVGAQVITDLFMLGLAALYFRKLLNELHVEHLRLDPFFWISVGLAVHALGDVFIALGSDYLRAHYSHQLQLIVQLDVRNLFGIAQYASYLLALWMRPPKLSS